MHSIFQTYIPSDIITSFPKVAAKFPEGDVWVDIMPNTEYNKPLFKAAIAKTQDYGLWVRILHTSGSWYTPPSLHGTDANKPLGRIYHVARFDSYINQQ